MGEKGGYLQAVEADSASYVGGLLMLVAPSQYLLHEGAGDSSRSHLDKLLLQPAYGETSGQFAGPALVRRNLSQHVLGSLFGGARQKARLLGETLASDLRMGQGPSHEA